ncbi:MAG TPA: biotin--[acetyl-CoA-carboxylase] ligase [Actinomycetota bacterium]|jgi:BirA family biotin operon repressor/biotin-[acetyl-CoA-carboxylase] ligase
MLSEHSVVEAARAAGIVAPAHYVKVTGSTNTDLLALAREGAPEWTLVVAGEQRSGRGRLGRTWSSLEGRSLLASILLRPELSPSDAPLLSLLVAVCMVRAIRSTNGVDVTCKWPNDLVVGERKLGGILTEASVDSERLSFVVVGTGVNVAEEPNDFPPELRPTATSILMEGGRVYGIALLREYLRELRHLYSPTGENLRSTVLAEYRSVCSTIGQKVTARTLAGGETRGRAVGISESGELLVRSGSTVEAVGFGEVLHLR